jgi:hypothetical protein
MNDHALNETKQEILLIRVPVECCSIAAVLLPEHEGLWDISPKPLLRCKRIPVTVAIEFCGAYEFRDYNRLAVRIFGTEKSWLRNLINPKGEERNITAAQAISMRSWQQFRR